MKFKCICVAITVVLSASIGVSQKCPDVKNEREAVQYLRHKKTSSTAADRFCVDGAFAILVSATEFRNKKYIKFLVGMLDFERWTPDGVVEASEEKYPAVGVLVYLQKSGKDVAPYLITGIKDSDSEVLRKNAAEALIEMDHCLGLTLLRQGVEKDIPYDQKERLEVAAKYILDNSSLMKPCDAK